MSTFTDTNFTYAVLSVADKTLSIVGLNTTKFSGTNPNWGTFPPIPLVYGGTNTTYNGAGNAANAYKITEIGASAFENRTLFSNTPLTSAFLTSNLTRIGDKAFVAVKLVGTLTIPENIVSIGTMAFYNCTLLTNIVIGQVTNSDVVSHLSDLTAVLNQEILDRKNADDPLHLLKAPIHNTAITGTATFPSASIATASVTTANVGAAIVETAVLQNATITTRLDVSGSVAFSDGSVTTTGQWDFTVQPKFNNNAIATEPFVNGKLAAIAGEGLTSTLNTLADIATAIGNDPSLAANITNGNTVLLNSIASEVSARGAAVTSLSDALSAANSSLLSTHAVLSTGLSTEISGRNSVTASLSTAVSASSASLSVVDAGLSTALSTEVSTRASMVTSLSTAVSASSASLSVVDAGLSAAFSAEVSTRASTVTSLSTAISTHRSALVSTDASISTVITNETAARSQTVSLASSAVSAAASSVVSGTASLTTALSVENSTRQSVATSLSASASGATSVLRETHLGVSSAFAAESTALSTSVASLSSSTSLQVSALASANASLSSAISTEKSVQLSQTGSLSVSASGSLASLMNANTALGGVVSAEVSVRDSQVRSVSAGVLGVSLPSLSTAASNLSTALSVETSTATSALSAEMSTLKANAPGTLDTLAEIAAELNTNPSLTRIASVMADVTATSAAMSTEIVNRVSAIASVSSALSSSVVALSSADASLSTVLSGEVSTRGSHVASLSAVESATTSAVTSANNATAAALATEVSVRAASVTSVGDALATASASVASADTALSTAISVELAARAGALGTFSTSLSTATTSLAAVHSLISTGISAENVNRAVAVTSVSSVLSASAAAMQTAITATTDSITAVSSEAALKTTAAYLSTQISAIIGGTPPDTLNALAEIGAALNNENNFAGTVTTALGTKAAVTDVLALSTALAEKADQTEYVSLSSVVTTKTANTTANNTSMSIAMINNAITTLIADVSALQANGTSVNPDTVAVNNVSLTDLQNWTNEIYIKMGLTNADGTLRTIFANGATLKYVGSHNLVPASEPLFIYANPRGTGPEWFAVVKQSTTMKTAISNYASGTSAPFIPSVFGQTEPVPFNNIVTTLMTDMSYMFANKTSFNSPIASWDTSNVTTMTSAFFNTPSFNQPIGAWNTSNVTDMSDMFRSARAFNQPIGSWNTSNVTNMAQMFFSATAFNQNISAWNTSKVTAMNGMFGSATAFNQPIGAWNTGAVTNMNFMFNNASAFNQPIGAWNVSNVSVKPPTNFSTGSQLTAQNIPAVFLLSLDANGVTVKYVGSAANVPASEPLFIYANPRGNGPEWFAVVKQDMKTAISNYASGTSAPFIPSVFGPTSPVPFNNIVTTLMSDMFNLFQNNASFNHPIASWDTGAVTNMGQMFYGTAAFNQPIGAWNTGAVTNMAVMFFNANAFNQPIGAWNTGAVTNMNYMFNNASAFNQNISAWNVSNVSLKPPTDFSAGSQLTTQNIPAVFLLSLDANGVTVKYVGSAANVPTSEPLFIYANPRGTGPEWFAVVKQDMKTAISNYASGTSAPFIPSVFGPTSPVPFNNIVTTLMTDMFNLFQNNASFNHPIASWDTGAVTNMGQMFYGTAAFNQPIGAWNTGAVTNMAVMFFNASAFNQPIGAWNTGAVTNMNYMFNNASAFNQNISAWNVSNVSVKPPTDFSTGSQLTAQNIPAVFLLSLDANGITVKYIGSHNLVPASEPVFIQANPRGTGHEWFAVVKQGMNTAISNYASGTSAPFIPSVFGQTEPVPFNNIVTTLMTDMSLIFINKTSFNSPIASWDTSNVTNMNTAFFNTPFNQPIGAWDTSKVTNMVDMFRSARAFNQPIGSWNTSNVTNMSQMFLDAWAFNQPIGAWNTSNVTTMNQMFNNASAFNQNISAWNVTNVTPKPPTDFSNNSTLAAQNIPVVFLLSLDANGVTVKYVGSAALVPASEPLFIYANPRGTGPEWFAVVKQGIKTAISNYADGTSAPFIPSVFGQTSHVPFNNIVTTLMTNMAEIFMNKTSFNSPIASWDTSNVTNMSYAFHGATVFNQPIGAWNTSNVTHMIDMFRSARAFNQPIGAWNTSNVTSMKQMFVFSDAFNQPIGTWNTSKVTTMNTMFAYTTAFNQPIGAWNTGAVTDMNLMFYSASQFNQDISAWNVASVTPKPPSNFSSLVLTNPPIW